MLRTWLTHAGIAVMAVGIAVASGCSKKEDKPTRPSVERPAPTTDGGTSSAAAMGSASISGTVSFTGTAQTPGDLDMAADPVCAQGHSGAVKDESVVVNANGSLSNVIVYVKSGLSGSYAAPTTAAVIDQVGCVYHPHVVALQVGQTMEIINSDDTTHNVHSLSKRNRSFNESMPLKGQKLTKSFTEEETFRVKCDVHPWMNSYVGVFDHPFFGVTGDDGSFTIGKLPAGTYTVAAWHELFGETTTEVTVADGATGAAEFSFGS